MECEQCREALSARLDGAPEPVPAVQTDGHLAGCPECRDWQRRAAAVTRRLRVRPVASGPDLADAVLARAWPPRTAAGRGARIALAVVAAGQLALAVAQLFGWHAGMLAPSPAPGDMSAHLFDESTAWNLALGIGMAWVAWRARASAGVVPVFGGFLAVLTAFCVRDLAAGQVTAARLAEHGLLLLGFSLLLVVRRNASGPAGPATADGTEPVVPGGTGVAEPASLPATGRRPGRTRLRPVDRHRAA